MAKVLPTALTNRQPTFDNKLNSTGTVTPTHQGDLPHWEGQELEGAESQFPHDCVHRLGVDSLCCSTTNPLMGGGEGQCGTQPYLKRALIH